MSLKESTYSSSPICQPMNNYEPQDSSFQNPNQAPHVQYAPEMLNILEKFFDTRVAVPPYRPNALTAFLMDFTEFEQGGKLYTNNGAWFVTPDMRQAAAGPDGKLLLMQALRWVTLNIHNITKINLTQFVSSI